MSIGVTQLGFLSTSRLILGGNPFSGFSHQSAEKDREMRRYFTSARIKATLSQAETLGISTFLGRADRHIQRVLSEYWDEGGKIQWIAQTCPEYASLERSIAEAIQAGARACFIHGGQMDHFFAQGQLEGVPAALAQMRAAGLAAGIASHNPRLIQWAAQNLELDFFMCAYYNPTSRAEHADHRHGEVENFADADREAMTTVISALPKPAIHYKVLAAGRKPPAEAFAYLGRHLRPQDAACIGVYPPSQAEMLAQDARLFAEISAARAPLPP
jgi:hypothetical protein